MPTLEKETSASIYSVTPSIDLSFPVIGSTLPADHGYGLYSALTHWNQAIHALEGLSIQTITGIPDKQGKIYLTERSHLRMRLSYNDIPLVYGLAGRALTIGNHTIRLGIPQIYLIQPASKLKARIVTIKGYQEPERFLEAALRQLENLGIRGVADISMTKDEYARKTIKIKQFTVVGFGVEISNLSDEHSLLLQQRGLGGKRHMGCGVFVPCRDGL